MRERISEEEMGDEFLHLTSDSPRAEESSRRSRLASQRWKFGITGFCALGGIIYCSLRETINSASTSPSSTTLRKPRNSSSLGLRVQYDCPRPKPAENEEEQTIYIPKSQSIVEKGVAEFLASFRDGSEFDNWGHSYNDVKKGMKKWKSRRFSELRNGSSIYESACGIGLNLFMTLEILYETHGITNLVVYGNEFVPESVDVARAILGTSNNETSNDGVTGFLPGDGQLGTVCVGDSAKLDYVPANSFDLVYTGYISPLFNPLRYNGTVNSNFEKYMAYCEYKTPHDIESAKRAQQVQNDWYASWVTEMIRIAKPGAPVIIEQVSLP
jgi:hypothetical protein